MRRIPGANKYVNPTPHIDSVFPPPSPSRVDSEISLDDIARQQLQILFRETRQLDVESKQGLLSPSSGVSFERCVKITREFKKEEREYLDSLTDEELDNLSKKAK